jgi:hypothetical protein
MPSDPVSHYHHIIIALDDAIMALRDALEASPSATALPLRERDRLRAMVAEMEEIQDRLEHNPRGVARERHEQDLLEAMDDSSRATP